MGGQKCLTQSGPELEFCSKYSFSPVYWKWWCFPALWMWLETRRDEHVSQSPVSGRDAPIGDSVGEGQECGWGHRWVHWLSHVWWRSQENCSWAPVTLSSLYYVRGASGLEVPEMGGGAGSWRTEGFKKLTGPDSFTNLYGGSYTGHGLCFLFPLQLSINYRQSSAWSISHFVRLSCFLIFLTGVLPVLLEWQSVPFFCYANVLTPIVVVRERIRDEKCPC
jgi:hypothetical protein